MGRGDRGVHVNFADVAAVQFVILDGLAAHRMRENAAEGSFHRVITEKAHAVIRTCGKTETGTFRFQHSDPFIEIRTINISAAAVVIPQGYFFGRPMPVDKFEEFMAMKCGLNVNAN